MGKNDSKKQFPKTDRKSGKMKQSQKKETRTRNGRDEDRKYRKEDTMLSAKGSEGKLSSLNDISWYARNPMLLDAAARIPFPYRPGMWIPDMAVRTAVGDVEYWERIPGVMAIKYAPTIGRSVRTTSPASLAAKEMYARIRSTFSGTIAADPVDLMIYTLALDAIFSSIGNLKRIYRLISTYDPNNYELPDVFLNACGIDDSNIPTWVADKKLLFTYITELVGMTKKFFVPKTLDVLNRHYWMNDNVYGDRASMNAQFYLFQPIGYYIYELDSESRGMLRWKNFPSNYFRAPSDAYAIIRGMIEALANSEDAYTISGYFARAYETDGSFAVDYLMENEAFVPVYVPEVLSQIQNMKTVPLDTSTLDITQDGLTNTILSTPRATEPTSPKYFQDEAVKISLKSENPTVVDVTIASRLTATMNGGGIIICGTEIPVEMEMYGLGHKDSTGREYADTTQTAYTISIVNNWAASSVMRLFKKVEAISKWDWHPEVMLAQVNDADAEGKFIVDFWDVENVTVIDSNTLENIHRVCAFSEFNSFSLN